MKNLIKTITLTVGLLSVSTFSHGYSFSSYPNFMGGYDFYGDVSGTSYPNFMGGYDYYINDNNSFGLWDY
jgi:hypothetical protein